MDISNNISNSLINHSSSSADSNTNNIQNDDVLFCEDKLNVLSCIFKDNWKNLMCVEENHFSIERVIKMIDAEKIIPKKPGEIKSLLQAAEIRNENDQEKILIFRKKQRRKINNQANNIKRVKKPLKKNTKACRKTKRW